MLLTQAHYTSANAFLTGANNAAVAQKALNASVRLQGPASSGTFTGSAVILGTGTEVAWDATTSKWKTTATAFTVLLTAKHSLYVKGNNAKVPDDGGTPKWNQDLVDGFKGCSIYYSTANNTFGENLGKTAKVDHVIPVFEANVGEDGKMIAINASASQDGKAFCLVNLTGTTTPDGKDSIGGSGGISPADPASAWAYDVMILLSKDAGLYTLASTAGSCDYQAGAGQAALEQLTAVGYVQANNFKPLVPCLKTSNVQLVQTGFGNASDQVVPKAGGAKITLPSVPNAGAQFDRLQFKLSQPTAQTDLDQFYTSLEADSGTITLTNTHGIVLDCDGGNNSTFSGDSGGPLFAFKKSPAAPAPVACLVGLTTGAGVAAEASGVAGVWEYDNNVATSLGFYYANLFDLRFQNV